MPTTVQDRPPMVSASPTSRRLLCKKSGSRSSTFTVIKANKHNFFKLPHTIKRKLKTTLDIPPFAITPLESICERWRAYVKKADGVLKHYHARIESGSQQLRDLLQTASKANIGTLAEQKSFLRALGAVCEEVFIGPYSIVVDLTHSCNTACIHCWVHPPYRNDAGYLAYRKEKMDVGVFERIVSEAASIGTDKICLLANGEPLMHPRIKDIIRICHAHHVEFETVTNGFFLSPALSRLIVDAGASSVTVSVPAATARRYKEICPRSRLTDFKKILSNVRYLARCRRGDVKRPQIYMTHVIHCLNYGDLFQFVAMDIALGIDKVLFKIILLDDQNYHLKLDKRQIDYLKANMPKALAALEAHGIETNELSSLYLGFYDKTKGLRTRNFFDKNGCLVGWGFCNLQLGGEALFCCGNKMVNRLDGNGFDTLWFSETYNRYRKAAKHMGKCPQVRFARGEKLCDNQCRSCENVNEHLRIVNALRDYSLERFL